MIASNANRVSRNTAARTNEAIRREAEERIAYLSHHREHIDGRLEELDREWDIERMLEAGSSCLSLLGLGLGVGVNRRWLALPIVVQGFFLLHALQGWCPPLPALRRLGFRTQAEIDQEKFALKALRGDFEHVSHHDGADGAADAGRVIEAVRRA